MVDVETSRMSAHWMIAVESKDGLGRDETTVVDGCVGTEEWHIIEVEGEDANNIPFDSDIQVAEVRVPFARSCSDSSDAPNPNYHDKQDARIHTVILVARLQC